MMLTVTGRIFCFALLALSLSACITRSHVRGCDLAHPYHEAPVPADLVVESDLESPRTRATFHVPDQQYLAPKPADLATEQDTKTLSKDELKAKRCIVAPPRLPAADAGTA